MRRHVTKNPRTIHTAELRQSLHHDVDAKYIPKSDTDIPKSVSEVLLVESTIHCITPIETHQMQTMINYSLNVEKIED
jgi:hypothetical protein